MFILENSAVSTLNSMVQGSDVLTIRGAIVNLCNTCIGIGILAKPFALAIVGWFGIIAFFLAAALVTYGGVCLSFASRTLLANNDNKSIMIHKPINYNSIDGNNNGQGTQIQRPKRSKSAFQLVSYESMGKYGELYAIAGFALIAWIVMSTCIIMVSQLLQNILSPIIAEHSIQPSLIFICSFIIYVPAALVLNFKQITFISWIGVISVIAILFTLILLMIESLYHFDGPPPIPLLIENISSNNEININSKDFAGNARKNMTFIEQFAFSLIIFMSGIAGNAAVPKISQSINNKSHLLWIVGSSYVMVSIFYCFIACIGYWLYGDYTNVMIINNFFIWPTGVIVIIVSLLVICNLWASFSIMLSLICDVLDSLFNLNLNQFGYRRSLRLLVFCFVFGCAYLLRYHLSFLISLGGVVGVLCSLALTLPILIYIVTFWNHPLEPLSSLSKVFHIILLAVCVGVGILAAYQDFAHIL